MTQAANLAALGTNAGTTGILPIAGGGTAGTGGAIGFKNRLINGAMVIDQRNAGASLTVTAVYPPAFTMDRFYVYGSVTSKYSVQQNAGSVTPPSGFANYLGITSLSSYSVGSSDNFLFGQYIEGVNVADLDFGKSTAKTVTLSFWVRSSLTGTFGGSLVNSASNRSYVFSYTINSANTWEQKSISISGDTTGTWLTNNGVGLAVNFSIGSGSNYTTTAGSWVTGNYLSVTGQTSVVGTNGATFYITGCQLEVGTAATNFDVRSYGTELGLCQRYYQRSYNIGTATGTSFNSNYEVPAYFIGTGNYGFVCGKTFPTSMRANPTITVYADNGTAGSVTPWNSSPSAIASVNAIQNGITAGNFNNNTSTGVVYGFAYTASAEL